MNIEKAIEIMKYNKHLLGLPEQGETWKENANTIACDLAISALEKQIPKKPIENFYDERDGEDWYDEGYTYSCPICLNNGSEVGRYSKESEQWIFEMKEYCDNCGQRLEVEE